MSDTAIIAAASIIGAAVFFISLERFFPYNKGQKFFRPGFWTDLFFYTIFQSKILDIIIFTGIIAWIDSSTSLSRLQIVTDWPIWLQLVFFTLSHDLYIYWFHRWQHKNRILWRSHEAHHSPEDVDWLAGSRSHPLEILINQTVEFAPIVLLGAPPEMILYKGMVSAIWGMWIHSNINVNTGRLQLVINGPEMHRWHHADQPAEALDKNFSTKLAVWDWLFGTAYLPPAKAEKYGLVNSRMPMQQPGPYQWLLILVGWEWLKQIAFAFRPFGTQPPAATTTADKESDTTNATGESQTQAELLNQS